MKEKLMIGVSTAQNTTNVLPAIQFKVDYFIAIETSRAYKLNWSEGMNSVLTKKGIQVLDPIVLKYEQDSRIDLIYNDLVSKVPENIDVIWNLGGGQKAQQFAMWQAFVYRAKQGINEVACYTNPEKRIIEKWRYNKSSHELEYFDENTNSTLTAADIFEIYGFQLDTKEDSLFYHTDKSYLSNQKLYTLLNYPEFRKFFFKLPKTSWADESNQLNLKKEEFINLAKKINDDDLKKIFQKEMIKNAKNNNPVNESIVPKLRKAIIDKMKALFNRPPSKEKIKIYNNELKKLLFDITGKNLETLEVSYDFFDNHFPNYRKISFLFEEMLKDKILDILVNTDNHILEAYTNVNTSDKKGNSAEYDVLLVTKWGTVISIDAKTYDATKKDVDARILNLRAGAGRYIEFVLCFPFYKNDFNKEWFPNTIKNLPKKLSQHHIKYFMITDEHNISNQTIDDQEIDFIPIDSLLTQFNLIKK